MTTWTLTLDPRETDDETPWKLPQSLVVQLDRQVKNTDTGRVYDPTERKVPADSDGTFTVSMLALDGIDQAFGFWVKLSPNLPRIYVPAQDAGTTRRLTEFVETVTYPVQPLSVAVRIDALELAVAGLGSGGPSGDGSSALVALNNHVTSPTPHPAYDTDLQDLSTLLENGMA